MQSDPVAIEYSRFIGYRTITVASLGARPMNLVYLFTTKGERS